MILLGELLFGVAGVTFLEKELGCDDFFSEHEWPIEQLRPHVAFQSIGS